MNSSLFKYAFYDNFTPLFGGSREIRKIFIEKIPVKDVDDKTNLEFQKIVDDIQRDYSDEKAKEIDRRIFDLYGLSKEEREIIGYIDYHSNDDSDDEEED